MKFQNQADKAPAPGHHCTFLTANDQESDQIRGKTDGGGLRAKPFVIVRLLRKIKAMFAMLEQRTVAVYLRRRAAVSGLLGQMASPSGGKPLTLSPMEYKMLNLFRKIRLASADQMGSFWKNRRRDIDEERQDEHT